MHPWMPFGKYFRGHQTWCLTQDDGHAKSKKHSVVSKRKNADLPKYLWSKPIQTSSSVKSSYNICQYLLLTELVCGFSPRG